MTHFATHKTLGRIAFFAMTVALSVLAAGAAFARDPVPGTDTPATPGAPATIAAPQADPAKPAYLQRPMFVDTRFTDQITQMRDAARERFINAGKWLDEAKTRRIERKGQVEIKKREIDTIEAKLKLAKKTGAEEDKTALEAEKKIEQEHMSYLKQLEALEEAAEKRWSAARNSASADDTMHGLQLDLASKRAQRDAVLAGQAPQSDRMKLETETRALVEKTLESMKKAASARRDLAGKEGDHIDHQLRVLKSWVALTPAG